jgi:16S rRNA processing protein RimM
VRGEVRIKCFTERPDAIAGYGPLTDEEGTRSFTLRIRGQVRGQVIARIEGIADRDAAEALRGLRLYTTRTALPRTKRNEWYLTDLEGLRVEDRDGQVIGRLRAVHDFGAGAVLEIERETAPVLWLPFTKQAVPVVDVAAGRIVVEPPAETAADDQRNADERIRE